MDRRRFLALGAAAAVAAGCENSTNPGAATAPSQSAGAAKPVKMHVGCQRSPTAPEMLQFFKRHGVNNICGYPPQPERGGHWSV
jgi:hypothetical protein